MMAANPRFRSGMRFNETMRHSAMVSRGKGPPNIIRGVGLNYYTTSMIDPDGNNVEAVWMG
jgi:hypothetical protein